MGKTELPVRCGAVAVVVLRGTGAGAQVLLLKRAKGGLAGLWSQVTGSLEADEAGWQAAVREVLEETGLQPRRLYSADFCDHFYDPESDSVEVVPMFVALVVEDAEVRLNEENSDHRWVGALEASEIVPFHGHRVALREIHRRFVAATPPAWMLISDFGCD